MNVILNSPELMGRYQFDWIDGDAAPANRYEKLDEDLPFDLHKAFFERVGQCKSEEEQKTCWGDLVAEAKRRRKERVAAAGG